METSLALKGSQRPRLEHQPATVIGTLGPRACAFAEACGVTLDEWQRYAMNGLFAVDQEGNWAASEFGLLVSRQNGKGEILVAYDLCHLFLFPRSDNRRKTLLHTAHEVKTAMDAFDRLTGVIQASPKLMARVQQIYNGGGRQAVLLKPREGQFNGDVARFIARSRNSGRGFAGDINVYDEAQEFSSQARSALTYTQSTITNRQELYTGTAPSEENNAEVFEGVRDRGRRKSGRATGWQEYTPEFSDDPFAMLIHPNFSHPDPNPDQHVIELGDPIVWEQAIPSLGIRIPVDNVVDQVERTPDILELARERFSYWPNRAPDVEEKLNDIDLEVWDHHKNDKAEVIDSEAEVIAISVGRGGGYATVAAAARYDADSLKVEHRKTDPGTMWIASYVDAIKNINPDALVILDSKNAASIIPDLDKAKIKYLSMNLTELTGAFSVFIERVNAGLVEHRDQAEVRTSLQYAIPRAVGQSGYTWDASDPTKPVSIAQAVTWACYGVLKREAQPPREPAIVRGRA